ncbi:hypothetical protein NUU61_004758 [Penicillium alfredii]|uniref:Uncharacterized protein n=1 Tax=Penicillium alfredii TaxID=1506179 RepID=A0A9W9K7W5_9EURO|nr:uncharacterized protein NUU61_004758 [Penicillium alfredii]KAJ5095402.1 hypothetical protein NUU61_004758 [Penicillium alfredii]
MPNKATSSSKTDKPQDAKWGIKGVVKTLQQLYNSAESAKNKILRDLDETVRRGLQEEKKNKKKEKENEQSSKKT